MDKELKFTALPISGVRTNARRLMLWRERRNMDKTQPIELYSPRVPKRRHLATETMGSLLVAFTYSLIALAIFVSWSNP